MMFSKANNNRSEGRKKLEKCALRDDLDWVAGKMGVSVGLLSEKQSFNYLHGTDEIDEHM